MGVLEDHLSIDFRGILAPRSPSVFSITAKTGVFLWLVQYAPFPASPFSCSSNARRVSHRQRVTSLQVLALSSLFPVQEQLVQSSAAFSPVLWRSPARR